MAKPLSAASVLSMVLLLVTTKAPAQFLLNFDDVAEGTVLDTHYRGAVFVGVGDGGPFEVIADTPCGSAASPPHVVSFRDVSACPESNNIDGWIEVRFAIPQPWVSVDAIHRGAGSISYLKAYAGPSEGDFLDQKTGAVGGNWVGVPQTLRIEREPHERQITRVSFGGVNFDANTTGFDNLAFALRRVPTETSSWSRIKALY